MTLLPHVTVDHGPVAADGPTTSVVWLHGLGADGHDFEAIVPLLGLPADLSVRFIFPHADPRPVTLNGGMVMRAWYDIVSLTGPRDADPEGVAASARQVEALLEAEHARGVPWDRIVVAGFSQGGAIAYHTGLRLAQGLAGILVLSAYLLDDSGLGPDAPANHKTPILQCHGTFDPVVTLPMGEEAYRTLDHLGYDVDWRTYPIAHHVSDEEIAYVGSWLRARLG